MCWLSYTYYCLVWFFIVLLLFILVIRLLAKGNLKKVEDYYNRTWKNQEEMIALLKEIRDKLKG